MKDKSKEQCVCNSSDYIRVVVEINDEYFFEFYN